MLPGRWLWPPIEHGICHISLLESHCFVFLYFVSIQTLKVSCVWHMCVSLCVCACVWKPESDIKCLPKYCGRIFDLNVACPYPNPIQLAWVCVPGLALSSPQTQGLQAGAHADSMLVLGSWTLVLRLARSVLCLSSHLPSLHLDFTWDQGCNSCPHTS